MPTVACTGLDVLGAAERHQRVAHGVSRGFVSCPLPRPLSPSADGERGVRQLTDGVQAAPPRANALGHILGARRACKARPFSPLLGRFPNLPNVVVLSWTNASREVFYQCVSEFRNRTTCRKGQPPRRP